MLRASRRIRHWVPRESRSSHVGGVTRRVDERELELVMKPDARFWTRVRVVVLLLILALETVVAANVFKGRKAPLKPSEEKKVAVSVL